MGRLVKLAEAFFSSWMTEEAWLIDFDSAGIKYFALVLKALKNVYSSLQKSLKIFNLE